jgi:hypothetical protein
MSRLLRSPAKFLIAEFLAPTAFGLLQDGCCRP